MGILKDLKPKVTEAVSNASTKISVLSAEQLQAIEKKRDDLLGRVIGKFPLRLSDVEQGEFILGYFHLRAKDLGERATRKKDAESPAEEE